MSPRAYCVVGGGISGLTAAYRLRAAAGADATITVFDPGDRLGGILRTEVVGGQPMDVGAEAFVLRRPEVPALLAELGLVESQRATTGVRPLIYSGQQLHALPSGTVMGIPTSASSLAGLVDDATIARIEGEPGRPFSWRPGSDPAVAELVADRFGEQTVARSVDPLLCGVYAGSAATIGLRAAAPTVAAALDHGAASLTDAVRHGLPAVGDGPVFGALDGGYRVLVDELVARSRAQWVRATVTQLEPGWAVCDDSGGRWPADAVILAIPAPRLGPLVDEIAPRSAAAARRITSASSAVVALAVPLDIPFPRCSGVLVASGERLRSKAITLSSRKWGPRGDTQLLRLSFGRFGDDLAERASDEELLAWSLDDLATVFGLAVHPIDFRVQRWIEAMPQYGPGHADLAAEVRAGLPAGLAVAGSYLDGIGVPACVAAADRAVTGIIEAL
ncbi:protoporphyrinogen oxidase [Mycobacterium kansasii]|uniref:Coproporphyrinogen III oxidase n=1 Tax=Mycobacterium attenuatum TaxID=2341086 RepID=A0A498PZB8_9MYCO|nr:protoporphyrinogen oxidase [Mycobacterium attenuatum]ORB86547.1 protoporphyrinogen oxidase [Mycobacterium kansasii]VBA37613.1 Protoporphyrinogen oxidase [Mycobacterium attenuatum]VBA56595.1 Protoporphyrinogen oxidase [Mycobacterium attenuatum]